MRVVSAHKNTPWLTAVHALGAKVQRGVDVDLVIMRDPSTASSLDTELDERLAEIAPFRVEHAVVEGIQDGSANHGLLLDAHFRLGDDSWKDFDAVLIMDSDCLPLTRNSYRKIAGMALEHGACGIHHISLICIRPDRLRVGLNRVMSFVPVDRKQRLQNPPANPDNYLSYFDTGEMVLAYSGATTCPVVPDDLFRHPWGGTRLLDDMVEDEHLKLTADCQVQTLELAVSGLKIARSLAQLGITVPTLTQVMGLEPYVLTVEQDAQEPEARSAGPWWKNSER